MESNDVKQHMMPDQVLQYEMEILAVILLYRKSDEKTVALPEKKGYYLEKRPLEEKSIGSMNRSSKNGQ